jgi:hypothetical protein
MGMKDKEETIQLVSSDGTLQIFHKSLTAAQIMEEFPQHLVCHSDSFYIGQKTPTLSANEQLKVGNKYFLLPQHFCQSPLSLLSLASLISPPPPPKAPPTSTARLSAPLRSIERASVFCQPFEIQKSDVGGGLRIRVCPEFISKLMEDARLNADECGQSVGGDSTDDEPGRLCNTPELQKDYAQLVKCRGQCWRPKLETIKENEKKINMYKLILKKMT